MATDITLPPMRQEEALSRIIAYMRRLLSSNAAHQSHFNITKGLAFKLPDVINEHLEEIKPQPPVGVMSYSRMDSATNSEPYYSAAFNLCSRGILAPAPVWLHPQNAQSVLIGGHFSITEYGVKWLQNAPADVCLPTEYARFAQLLSSRVSRFGAGYNLRSQEAIKCYEAHIYFACCAMCGAAAESILLATAIAKNGSEDYVLREYRTGGGRTKIENMLIGQQTAQIKDDFTNYMSLLKYWRDESAHGASVSIQEEEAFTSLLLLLRFAQFTDNRWTELTT